MPGQCLDSAIHRRKLASSIAMCSVETNISIAAHSSSFDAPASRIHQVSSAGIALGWFMSVVDDERLLGFPVQSRPSK
jgi:hypothetical protein